MGAPSGKLGHLMRPGLPVPGEKGRHKGGPRTEHRVHAVLGTVRLHDLTLTG
ncbi:hypothetical protein ABT001_12840 [Streptomyces sp. NPDC002793]|uniref:hypothetical protein n=1 Tax=Streptomyces sp. NPDC002793 TaxID=3154432 RepID=UPI003330F1FB